MLPIADFTGTACLEISSYLLRYFFAFQEIDANFRQIWYSLTNIIIKYRQRLNLLQSYTQFMLRSNYRDCFE